MITLSTLVDELKDKTEFQQTPREFSYDDYIKMVVYGLKRLYIDTGRASVWTDELIEDDNFMAELPIDEIEYVMLLAQIKFYETVRAAVNEMVSYTTDALSVTQGDKPYQNLTGTLRELDNERRIVYYKMSRYALGDT